MFDKASRLDIKLCPEQSERLSDLLYEIGKDLLDRKEYELAERWLQRAYSVLIAQDLEELSIEAGDLRLSIMHAIGRDPIRQGLPALLLIGYLQSNAF